MKVFISWSGDKSHKVALALRDWLPGVINVIEPFVSSKDIYAGTRWQSEIAVQLDTTNFGIVCVTRDNQASPWLNFEAGALAKVVDSSRVVPLACDLKPSDIEIPLGQFQAQPATEEGLEAILSSINGSISVPLKDALLLKAAKMWWPELATKLEEIENAAKPPRKGSEVPTRSERELLEETLDTVRSLARSGGSANFRTEGAPVAKDHPLVGEMHKLLGDDDSYRILHSSAGRIIGVRTGAEVPADVEREIRRRGDIYGIRVEFMVGKSLAERLKRAQLPHEAKD